MTRPFPMKTLGLVGGCSNVATVQYYDMMNASVNAQLGGWEIAETLIAGMNFGNIEALLRAGNWDGLSRYLEQKVDSLIAGGADAVLCASNTLHKPLAPIMAERDTPFLHIADPTGAAIRASGLTRIALFGTASTMQEAYLQDYYRDHFDLEILTPTAEEQADIDRIIFDELIKNDIRDASKQRYLDIADRMVRESGAEGVILGCTEIFLLMKQEDRPSLPMFNTTALHCEAAVEFALSV